jgi:hypothetical protein
VAQDRSPRPRRAARRLARPSLRARLVAVTLCLLAAGAVAISAASAAVARSDLTRQANDQLHWYAGWLASQPFRLFPASALAPGAAPALGPGARSYGVAVRAAGGQPLLAAGPPIPAGRGNWLVVSEPVRYQARHIQFVYGAEDTYLVVSGPDGRGGSGTRAGSLLVGRNLAGVDQAAGRLARTCLALSGAVLLTVALAAFWILGVILRARRDTEQAAAAAAAEAANAARARTDQLAQAMADAAGQLRKPLSVLHGIADYFSARERLGADDIGRLMERITAEATRLELLLAGLPTAGADACH